MRNIIQTCKATILASLLLAFGLLPFLALPAPSVQAAGYCPTTSPTCYEAAEQGGDCQSLDKCDIILNYVDPLIYFLTALVGVGVVISIIVGGIQYSSSAGDPSKASAAKTRIRDALIALVTYILLFAMLNFLIPGGLIGG